MSTGVWELTICDADGTTLTNHDTVDDAYTAAAGYVAERWDALVHNPGTVLPTDARRAVADYFRRVEKDGVWFSISVPMDLESPVMVHELERLPSSMVRWNLGPAGWEAVTKEEAAERSARINAEQLARMAAAAAEKQAAKYPVRWPAKHKHVLDAIRETVAEVSFWTWTWYRDAGAKGGIPKGAFVLDNYRTGQAEVYASIDELAEHLELLPVKKTPVRKPAAPKAAPAVADHRGRVTELVDFIRKAHPFILNAALATEAAALLEAA